MHSPYISSIRHLEKIKRPCERSVVRDRRRSTSALRKLKGVLDHVHEIPVERCECLHRLLLSGRLYIKKLREAGDKNGNQSSYVAGEKHFALDRRHFPLKERLAQECPYRSREYLRALIISSSILSKLRVSSLPLAYVPSSHKHLRVDPCLSV